MDGWFQRALLQARQRGGAALDEAYASSPAFSFYYDPGSAAQALVGVLRPSRDRVGRQYPFLVGFETEARLFDAHRLSRIPVFFEPFYERAAQLVGEATAGGIDYNDLPARTDSLGAATGEAGSAGYSRYLQNTTANALWERLWGYADDSRKYLLFKNLLDILLPVRGRMPGSFPLLLRFPLCPDGHTTAFDVSFWLEVCLRLLAYPALRPSFFWSAPAPGEAARPPFLLLSLSPPAAVMFTYLLPLGDDGDTLCDLEHMGNQRAVEAVLSIPPPYNTLIDDSSLSLEAFLRRL
jgi:type VI secretion system protein ImpM